VTPSGDSVPHFGDVTTVIVRQGEALDLEYMFRWARRLGIGEELAYVLDQSSGQVEGTWFRIS
jgi:hypothetical protein